MTSDLRFPKPKIVTGNNTTKVMIRLRRPCGSLYTPFSEFDFVPDDVLVRFFLRFVVDETTGCWPWTGPVNPAGYGYICCCGVMVGAHRIAYLHFRGRVEPGLTLDHLCRVRRCVNPDHLEPVSRGENVRRGDAGLARGLQMRSKTHCANGHEYSGENLGVYIDPRGYEHRLCRTCCRANLRASRARQKARLLSAGSSPLSAEVSA